jgi:hypothetical protein
LPPQNTDASCVMGVACGVPLSPLRRRPARGE